MKILFFVHALASGGAERVLVTLANRFVDRGDDVCISCDIDRGLAFDVNSKIQIYNHRKKVLSNKLKRRFAPIRFAQMIKNMREIHDEFKPDIVISFITTFNIYTLMALIGKRTPVIICEHTTVSFVPPFREKIMRDLIYHRADAITVLTTHDYRLWKTKYPQVVVMPNPCESLETNFDCSIEKNKTIIAAGRVTDWHLKGFDTLIKSWSSICHNYPDWHLEIAGLTDESSMSIMNNLIKQYNGININFLGFRKDVYQLMNRAEVFCLTSRREGLPMALIEAMSVGCCCISFDVITGPSDIITDKEDGFLIKDQDVDSFTKTLRQVLDDSELRHSIANKAPLAVKKFEVENIVDMWYNLFNKVMSARN